MRNWHIIICLILSGFACNAQSDTTRILNSLKQLIKTPEFRTHTNLHQLNATADYILKQFSLHADTSYFQTYRVNGKEYKNVIAEFGDKHAPILVIGAHYDVCGAQEGADDNASGVAGLLELSHLVKNESFPFRLQLVAYTLEEPPHFRTENMGSYVHASSLANSGQEVLGMICLEMIGYFSNTKGSQDYPLGILKWVYGSRGNYITLVNKVKKGKFSRKFSSAFKRTALIKTKKFTAPAALPGIDFSDHLNYWKFGFSALMITDTAFYRNKNYHQPTDTLNTLNIGKMAQVINAVYLSLLKIS